MEIDQSIGLKKDTVFDKIILYTATVLFASSVVLATSQVLIRVLSIPVPGGAWWTEPLARYTLIVGTFFGAAVASRNQEHISLELALDMIETRHPVLINGLKVIARIITIVFLIIASAAAIRATVTNVGVGMAEIRAIPRSVMFGLIAISFVAMSLYEILNIKYNEIDAIREYRAADDSIDGQDPDREDEL